MNYPNTDYFVIGIPHELILICDINTNTATFLVILFIVFLIIIFIVSIYSKVLFFSKLHFEISVINDFLSSIYAKFACERFNFLLMLN